MQPEINQEAIARMLDQVQKPTRYTGGEMNTQLKPWDSAKLHFAFCFPDTYEVGHVPSGHEDSLCRDESAA